MARPCIIFTDVTTARAFRAAIKSEIGYPLPGVPIGGGHTSRGARGVTLEYADLLKHPSRNEWAFPDDPVIVGKRSRVPLPVGATLLDIDTDATWRDASPGFMADDPNRERRM